MEHNTMDQPWDPISAVTSALVGDIGSIAMSVADFPREIFTGNRKGKKAVSQAGTPTGTPKANSTDDLSSTVSVATTGVPPSGTASHANEPGSSAASINSLPTPSVTTTSSITSATTWPAETTSPEGPLSPQAKGKDKKTRSRSPCRGCHRWSCHSETCSGSKQVTLETAIGAGKGVGRILETGMKTPLNFTMGLARGFRNAPKLYNDDTVRPQEKVTDFASGLKVAGKEFGFGFYDGISGLITQPLKGAEKEGAAGLLKGFGKGVGGLVLKSGAAVWSLPAYTMAGMHAEVRNRFSRSSINYIITSRVLEGKEQLGSASGGEQRDIVVRWRAKRDDLKGYYNLKQKEHHTPGAASVADDPFGHHDEEDLGTEPKTGWWHTRHLSFEERRKLHERKEEWKKRQVAGGGSAGSSSSTLLEDEELDKAIRASVQQTSKGDREEDVKVEMQIRASIKQMRKIAEQSRDFKAPGGPGSEATVTSSTGAGAGVGQVLAESDQDLANITDEEYQALVEEAVRQSLVAHGEGSQREHVARAQDEDELRRAIEESKAITPLAATDDEEAVRRAMEESERAHRERLEKEKTEEEIVMQFVKRQSLAEEEYRASKAKGKAVAGQGHEDDDDEDLKKALEESMRISRGGGEDGPSGVPAGH